MKDIKRIYTAHTINTIALSIIGVYVPAYLLTLGYPLSRVILFYIISHGVGLLFGLFLFVPLVQRWGILNTFKIYYPLEILYLVLLSTLKTHHISPEIVGIFNGLSIFSYWIPLNIFFIKHSANEEMGNIYSKFLALPNLFGIFGPLIGAILIPYFGFMPVFIITIVGLLCSFIPLASLNTNEMKVTLNFSKAWTRIKRNKTVFIFEFFENIIEESEWFWGIYVFIVIGSLATPGIIGSLEAIGSSLFTLLIGKLVNKHAKKMIPVTAILLLFVISLRLFLIAPTSAYVITIAASFLLSFFMIAYYTTIYRTVKNDNEEEFMILREIPVVLGRLVVFGGIYLTIIHLKYFFVLPVIFVILLVVLYYWKKKSLYS